MTRSCVKDRKFVRWADISGISLIRLLICGSGAKVVEEYRKMIAQGHSDTCPWRTTGCDGPSP